MVIEGFVALYIFTLAAIAGFEVISKVPAVLHTPLMSGSNFVSGLVLIGAIIALATAGNTIEQVLGFIAVVMATANAVGGYAVTERMLQMFKKKGA